MSGYETFQLAVMVLLGSLWGLATLARRRPDVTWLQPFRTAFPQPTEAQRQRQRRRADTHAGVELILLGLVIPIGYVALTLMTFSDTSAVGLTLAAAGSLLCIGLGVTAIVQNR